MSQYSRPLQTSTTKPCPDGEDMLVALQNIPSNFDLALNGGADRTFLSPKPKAGQNGVLDQEGSRRPLISPNSAVGRGVSPYHQPSRSSPKTWRAFFWEIWHQNEGCFLVMFSQVFGALMNVTARLLEVEGDGMNPFQLLFIRQGLTAILCTGWMWYSRVPDFLLGSKSVRWLLVVRSITGFFGIFGMYCELQLLSLNIW